MSKDRIHTSELIAAGNTIRGLQIELKTYELRINAMKGLLVAMLDAFGSERVEHDAERVIALSKKAVAAVTPYDGLQTFSNPNQPWSDVLLVIRRRKDPTVRVRPLCSCGGKTPTPVADDDPGKHEDDCVYWRTAGGVVRPQRGPATKETAETYLCGLHKKVGPPGSICPDCEAERADRVECATPSSLVCALCALCARGARQLYRFLKRKGQEPPAEIGYRAFCQECGESRGWNDATRFLPLPRFCGHAKKSHLQGQYACKIGDCDCERWTCSHSEKRVDREKKLLRCADPDCDWSATFDELLEKREEKNDGKVDEVQEQAEAIPAGREVASAGERVQDDAVEGERLPPEPGE